MTSLTESLKVSKEAFAYTPGLKVKQLTTVRKVRRLPILGDTLVNEGDEVTFDTVIGIAKVPGDPELIKATIILGVEQDEIKDFIIKREGDLVKKDEILGRYRMLFGLINREVISPIDGEIETISELTGQIIIRPPPIPIEVKAYIPGKVINLLPKEGAIIETNAALIQGIFGLGGETHGILKVVVNNNEEKLTADKINEDYKGLILVGGSLIDYEAVQKAVKVGVAGLVAGGVNYIDIEKILGQPLGVAITGEEELGLSLIITEGFGKMNMSKRTFQLLKSFEGSMVSINGTTQIRAGVMRPEIIIPRNLPNETEIVLGEDLSAGMIPGTPIRIIRQPYFGAIGEIVKLPVELETLESGSKVRVVIVRVDGREVIVPRANVEIIEE